MELTIPVIISIVTIAVAGLTSFFSVKFGVKSNTDEIKKLWDYIHKTSTERDKIRSEENKEIKEEFRRINEKIGDEIEVVHRRISDKDEAFTECMKGISDRMHDNHNTLVEKMDEMGEKIADVKVDIAKTNGDVKALSERLEVSPCRTDKSNK